MNVKVLVAYGSRLGSTAEIADRIGTVLRVSDLDVTVRPATRPIEPRAYDAFVIGGGTYAGRWHADAVTFVRRYAPQLQGKPVWLFSSGPLGATGGTSEPRDPAEMTELVPLVGARSHAIFAGAYVRSTVDGSELNRLEKFVAKRFIPEGDWRDWSSIEAWARNVARDLAATRVTAL